MAELNSRPMPSDSGATARGIQTTLTRAAAWMGAEQKGEDRPFAGVSTDSRAMPPGALFIALRGPRFDGHDHAPEAVAAGAAAVVTERPLSIAAPQLLVPDTRRALGALAAAWRRACPVRVVAITGSNGKTTVKEMCAAILSQAGPVLATRGNLNNEIGVPLTLLRLSPEHRHAVVEMGANHAGEIGMLTGLARPDAALITNAAAAHLEGFGSLEGVARAKGEIYSGLEEQGVALINADDPFAPLWRELAAGHRVMTFGLREPADIAAAARLDGAGAQMSLRLPDGEQPVRLALLGRHNVQNALAAAAAAAALGIDRRAIAAGLAQMRPVAGRLAPRPGSQGAHLIDDSYNANPASLGAALEVLAACEGRRYLVLGDMAELGAEAEALHRRAGEQARAAGIDRLYATGRLSRLAAERFGSGGHFFAHQEALIEALRSELSPEVTVLVKGSRAARMERVVAALGAGGEG